MVLTWRSSREDKVIFSPGVATRKVVRYVGQLYYRRTRPSARFAILDRLVAGEVCLNMPTGADKNVVRLLKERLDGRSVLRYE
jgi:hypothetical protein